MNKNIQYILLVFLLCFGIKAQAQIVTAYEAKLRSLSTIETGKLDHLVNGAPSSMFVTFENEAKVYYGNGDLVLGMSIAKVADITQLATTFENKLNEIEIINIEWDGQEEIVLPIALLNKMSNLKYIYIRSYQVLNESLIQSRFQNMMNILREKENVEVLYYTMEQPR